MSVTKNKKQDDKRGRNRGRGEDGQPNPVDIHVGQRLRLRRTLLGMSQEKLGKEIGLTFQQVQKYERGANRIGASRLFDCARVLDVPISFFFDDLSDDIKEATVEERRDMRNPPGEDEGIMNRRETLELVRAYYGADEHVRTKVFELLKTLRKQNNANDIDKAIKDSAA